MNDCESIEQALLRQAEMLYDIAGLVDDSEKDILANHLFQFRQEKLSISRLKEKLDVFNKILFYVLYFLDTIHANFTHQSSWTDDETLLLIASVFRNGKQWKSVSNDLFKSPIFDESCRRRYERIQISNILGIGEVKKKKSAFTDILEEIHHGNYKKIANKAEQYEKEFMNVIEIILEFNPCYAFVFAKITQYYIENNPSRKETLLRQLSSKRNINIYPFIQWCLTLGIFERIEIMHYVPDIPIGFFSIPFIDEKELFARGDPQLMSKIKTQQKEIKKLSKKIYNPKIILDLESILIVDFPLNIDGFNENRAHTSSIRGYRLR